MQERGFNQAELIAKSFCEYTGYTLKVNGLERIKNTQALFGLNLGDRQEQMQNALTVGLDFQKRLPKTPVLIVDDIYTTGTTASEAAKVLQKIGIKVIGVAAIASPNKV